MNSALRTAGFFEHIDSFVDYRSTVYEASPQTMKTNLSDIRLFERFMKEGHHRRITGPLVMKFQGFLKTERENCGASVNRKLFSLRSYARHLNLLEVKQAGELPFQDVLKIRGGYKSPPGALTVEQIPLLFDQIEADTCLGIRDYCIYAFMYNLGLRVGEVHGLDLADVDLEAKTIRVTGKGNKQRTLHLTREFDTILRDWLEVRCLFTNADDLTCLFVSKKGNRMAIRTMEDNFKKLVQAAGLKTYFNVTCHTLRHSFASHLNDKEVDILILQSLLGHTSPRSTEVYIHPSEQRQREALENLPCVKFVNRLVDSGAVTIRFQKGAKRRIEVDPVKLEAAVNS